MYTIVYACQFSRNASRRTCSTRYMPSRLRYLSLKFCSRQANFVVYNNDDDADNDADADADNNNNYYYYYIIRGVESESAGVRVLVRSRVSASPFRGDSDSGRVVLSAICCSLFDFCAINLQLKFCLYIIVHLLLPEFRISLVHP